MNSVPDRAFCHSVGEQANRIPCDGDVLDAVSTFVITARFEDVRYFVTRKWPVVDGQFVDRSIKSVGVRHPSNKEGPVSRLETDRRLVNRIASRDILSVEIKFHKTSVSDNGDMMETRRVQAGQIR